MKNSIKNKDDLNDSNSSENFPSFVNSQSKSKLNIDPLRVSNTTNKDNQI